MPRKALLIIGDGNSGKSSIIAALTGSTNLRGGLSCNKRIRDLRDRNFNSIRVLVYESSSQERNVSPSNFLKSNRYSCIINSNYDLLVMPLQIVLRKRRQKPWTAMDYIQVLLNNAGISDIRAIILHQISTGNTTYFNNLINYLNNKNIKYINLINMLQVNNQRI